MRLRGTNPAIEVSASNVSFLLGETATPGGTASMAIRQGPTMDASSAFFYVSQAVSPASTTGAPGAAVCGTDVAAASFIDASAAEFLEPTVSLRTFSDTERARIDGRGLSCASLTADGFTNLVGDYVTTTAAFLPPSAAALAAAYTDLSNQIVRATVRATGDPAGTSTSYGGLMDTYASPSVLNAPTANALRAAYFTLSNMIAQRLGDVRGSLAGIVGAATSQVLGALTSSVVAAAVAAASNGGSNIAEETYDQQVIVVYVNSTASNNADAASNAPAALRLVNDAYICSTPDGDARFYFASSGPTTVASSGNGGGPDDKLAFAWYVTDMAENVMELSGSGALAVRTRLGVGGDAAVAGGLAVAGPSTLTGDVAALGAATVSGALTVAGPASFGGAATLCNAAVVCGAASFLGDAGFHGDATFFGDVTLQGSRLTMGDDVAISYFSSNIGINLPLGTAPVCALHVNGAVFSEEGLFELSDESVKTDIEPLKDALDKVMRIRGCSYQRTDMPPPGRQIGVIAQNVNAVVPEAVHIGADGRMSVAYGNLVALAIEAIREVSTHQRALEARLELLEGRSAPHGPTRDSNADTHATAVNNNKCARL